MRADDWVRLFSLVVWPVQRLTSGMEQALNKMDYEGVRVLVTAGPTVEDIDPVRFISNRSSGKMGVALAAVAAGRGARVTLVHGPLKVAVPSMTGIHPVTVRSARDMFNAVMAHGREVDIAILCAAVADFTPVAKAREKIKKTDRGILRLELERTPDILAELGRMADKPFLVGFAAETEALERNARSKLARKNCDMLCANDISEKDSGFESETNRITIYRRDGERIALPLLSKAEVAERILDEILTRFPDAGKRGER